MNWHDRLLPFTNATPECLVHKREVYKRFRSRRILMAVPGASLRAGAPIPEDVLVYKSTIKVQPVLESLERLRSQGKPK